MFLSRRIMNEYRKIFFKLNKLWEIENIDLLLAKTQTACVRDLTSTLKFLCIAHLCMAIFS